MKKWNSMLTKEYLEKEYEKERKMKEIAHDIGCSLSTILRYFRKYGIKTRRASDYYRGKNRPRGVKQKISQTLRGRSRSEGHRKHLGEAIHRYYIDHPDVRIKIGERFRGRPPNSGSFAKGHIPWNKDKKIPEDKIRSGKDCPWYGKHLSEEHKLKLSKALRGRHLSEEDKKNKSESMKKWHREHPDAKKGKNNPMYGKVTHGKGRWFIKRDGNKIYLRSSWEVKVAELLEGYNLLWEYESKTFPIAYQFNGEKKNGTYTPDFWVEEWQKYIEVKGFWRGDAKPKFDAFLNQYPEIGIVLLEEIELFNHRIIYESSNLPYILVQTPQIFGEKEVII